MKKDGIDITKSLESIRKLYQFTEDELDKIMDYSAIITPYDCTLSQVDQVSRYLDRYEKKMKNHIIDIKSELLEAIK